MCSHRTVGGEGAEMSRLIGVRVHNVSTMSGHVPGPLFTFAAYLGKLVNVSPHGVPGAALGLIGIFLPGILILLGTLPFWDSFRKRASAQATMRGVNAAVV
jgi:chromate transport protein ChrA